MGWKNQVLKFRSCSFQPDGDLVKKTWFGDDDKIAVCKQCV